MKTLEQILKDVNAYVDLDASVPTGTELEVRKNYANQAVEEWAAAYTWPELNETMLAVATNTTISIPNNFRESVQSPRKYRGDDSWEEYVMVSEQDQYTERSDRTFIDPQARSRTAYISGNAAKGYVMSFHNLEEMATISFIYQRFPSGMATLSSICEVPDPEYVKTKVVSYVLQSRSDERFPIVDAEAKTLLQRMIGRSMKPINGGIRSARRSEKFRIA